MGNLRNKYTNEEWDEIKSKIDEDRDNGKPDENELYLSIWDLKVDELRKIREALSQFYDNYDLSLLDEWIAWKGRKNQ
jgi:hypothetical protein